MWAAGSNDIEGEIHSFFLHWNGEAWQTPTLFPLLSGRSYYFVADVTNDNLWAVGSERPRSTNPETYALVLRHSLNCVDPTEVPTPTAPPFIYTNVPTETVPPFLESVVPAQLTSFSELYIAVSMSKCSTSLASVS